MPKAVITFSDGSTLTLHEDDLIRTLIVNRLKGKDTRTEAMKFVAPEQMGYSDPIDLSDYHVKYGLIPDLVTIFHNADYFFLDKEPDVVYNTSSIVKIDGRD